MLSKHFAPGGVTIGFKEFAGTYDVRKKNRDLFYGFFRILIKRLRRGELGGLYFSSDRRIRLN